MSEEEIKTDAETPQSPWREMIQPFVDFAHAPRALWGINISYMLEGLVYFGMLSLLPLFFNRFVGMNDLHSDWMVSFLTGGITLSMLFFGGVADKIGVRRAMVLALFFMLSGRFILVFSLRFFPEGQGVFSGLFWTSAIGLLGVIIGYGLYQPAAYAGVREYCDERTSAMGYAMLYAVMNLGGALPGIISPPIRHAFSKPGDDLAGIPAVFWTYVGITAAGIVILMWILTKKVEKQVLAEVLAYRKANEQENAEKDAKELKEAEETKKYLADQPWTTRTWHWITNHPLADPKFTVFIFALIPVQTLFAHNWLTLPQYVYRALGDVGKHYMEFFVNSVNPILIFVLTPTVAAMTRKRNVYKMMIAGTFVMALPTFLLALKPSIWLLLAYLFIMSVGEAMWQPRFLQYAAEIAPKGRTGAYMGVAQFPWFLTKVVTGLYAGWFLMRYCPAKGPQNTETMWFIYALIAMVSPILLVILKGWLGKDFKTKA